MGRDERKLARIAAEHGLERFSTDLDACLADPELEVYFDATSWWAWAVSRSARPATRV